MFIGREKELTLLQQDYIGKAVMVYGKRRVGKTTLIQKALENCQHQTVYYECSKGAMQDNIDGLVRELARVKMLPVPLNFSTLQDVFIYLNALPKKIVVVIDEYPYLKKATDSATVDSIFQNIIDNRLSNIELVLSGSHIGMMKDLLQERNALYGRFAVTIKLNELNYLDAARFYPDRTPYDKVAHYAVFGGSPFVNQALNPAATLRENVISTILNPVSAVYLYASQLLLSDYSVKINAERIFSVIGNGKKRYTEIEDKLDVKKTGNLSKQIKSLTELEIVSRNSPINKIGDNKKATFEINDNLLRFYFTFIYKNASALQVLGAEAFYDEYGGKDGLVLANQAGNLRRFLGIILGVKALQDDLLAVDTAGLVDFVGCHLRTDVKVDTVFCAVTRNRADDRQGNGIFRTACCCICRIAVYTAASQRTGTKRSRQQGTKLFFHGFASPLNFELLC